VEINKNIIQALKKLSSKDLEVEVLKEGRKTPVSKGKVTLTEKGIKVGKAPFNIESIVSVGRTFVKIKRS